MLVSALGIITLAWVGIDMPSMAQLFVCLIGGFSCMFGVGIAERTSAHWTTAQWLAFWGVALLLAVALTVTRFA